MLWHRFLAVAVGTMLSLELAACKQASTSGLRDATDGNKYDGYEGQGLSPAQERGRRLWYEACGDNGRFHTYTTGQRVGAPENWGKVLASENRDQRWGTYGLIPDPDCVPGNDQSYGFDICDGDQSDDGTVAPQGQGYDGLLKFVGKTGYKDPGCWISGSYNANDCPLGLGTSTGAMGYRKFPNPRFDPNNWPGWDNYDPNDGSVEPPFLVGTACGSCHISFSPINPPDDPNHPKWANIKGLVGAQFQNISEIIASGTDPHSIEWQGYTNARAGTVDTSAHPNDLVYNPGTPNAIINLDKRPTFTRTYVDIIDGQRKTQTVNNILKGGEDDVGGSGAVLRVYINIGTCAETCWVNHFIDNRSISGRGSEQTPFDVNQCRRDCPSYAALEKHFNDGDFLAFFTSTPPGRPTDLKDGLYPSDPPDQRYAKLVNDLGADKVKEGRRVYARECAKCHSSQVPPDGQAPEDFFADLVNQGETGGYDPFLKQDDKGVRIDWLGNEQRTPVTTVGTVRCRSLHSNHMRGHIWDVFSSEDYKNSPTPDGIPELKGIDGGGRGYYRNISLLSVWTQAPFMHNNAIGPELCSKTHPRPVPCVDKDAIQLANGQTTSNVTIQGRLKMFEDSMQALLNPQTRGKKISVTDADIVVPIGPQSGVDLASAVHGFPFFSHLGLFASLIGGSDLQQALSGAKLVIPKGTPVALLASLDYRRLAQGIISDLSSTPLIQRPQALVQLLNTIFQDPNGLAQMLQSGPRSADPNVYSGYSTCTDVVEDKGHEFGASLSDADKDALIAFMKTL